MDEKAFKYDYNTFQIKISDVFYKRENCPIMNRKKKGKRTDANK